MASHLFYLDLLKQSLTQKKDIFSVFTSVAAQCQAQPAAQKPLQRQPSGVSQTV